MHGGVDLHDLSDERGVSNFEGKWLPMDDVAENEPRDSMTAGNGQRDGNRPDSATILPSKRRPLENDDGRRQIETRKPGPGSH